MGIPAIPLCNDFLKTVLPPFYTLVKMHMKGAKNIEQGTQQIAEGLLKNCLCPHRFESRKIKNGLKKVQRGTAQVLPLALATFLTKMWVELLRQTWCSEHEC